MKIRDPRLIQMVVRAGVWVVRGWGATVQFKHRAIGPVSLEPRRPGPFTGRYIYSLWHEDLILLALHYARPDLHVLISQHADGEIIAGVCERLGFSTVRGSKTRGGTTALRNMLRLSRSAHLGITPDGPSGPRRQVQPGIIYLAARTGLGIVPMGVGYRHAWRAKSWDRFAIPKPWSQARCVTGGPVFIPAGADRDQMEAQCLRVQEAMNEVSSLAEQWAETGDWPEMRNQESGIRGQESGIRNQSGVRSQKWRGGSEDGQGRKAA